MSLDLEALERQQRPSATATNSNAKSAAQKRGAALPVGVQLSMRERRENGLRTPLDASNKGFQMLTKMGYRQGQPLGRSAASVAEPAPPQRSAPPLVEPLELILRGDRGGLGQLEGRKRARELQEQQQQKVRRQRAQHFARELASVRTGQVSASEYERRNQQ